MSATYMQLLPGRPARRPGDATALWTRRLVQIRAGLGTAHLLFPGLAAGLVAGQPLSPRARGVVRVLGARQLAQALATVTQPTAAVRALGAGVDAAHTLSMVALGLLSPRWRRAAFADALIATGFAVAGYPSPGADPDEP